MWLSRITYKPIHNPHYLCNIKSYAYHCTHETSNNIWKQDSLHCFQVCITLKTHILQKFTIGHNMKLYWFTFNHFELLQYTSNVLALVWINLMFCMLCQTQFICIPKQYWFSPKFTISNFFKKLSVVSFNKIKSLKAKIKSSTYKVMIT